MATTPNEPPVMRKQGESLQMFGRRRKAQIRRWHADDGIDPLTIATLHGVGPSYVNDAVGIRSPGYEWVPPREVVEGPFPTFEEAWREEPLIPEEPGRMT